MDPRHIQGGEQSRIEIDSNSPDYPRSMDQGRSRNILREGAIRLSPRGHSARMDQRRHRGPSKGADRQLQLQTEPCTRPITHRPTKCFSSTSYFGESTKSPNPTNRCCETTRRTNRPERKKPDSQHSIQPRRLQPVQRKLWIR